MNFFKLSNNFYIIVSLLFLIFLYYYHPIPLQDANVDLGHHLLLGKVIVNEKNIPQTNIFVYTTTNFHYINTSWLSEVVFYLWETKFSFNGLLYFGVTLMIITFLLLLKNDAIKGKIFTSTCVFLLYIQIIIERIEIKPEIFSLLFLSIFLFILYKYKNKTTKWIFILPFLEVIWVNLHIYFIIGPIVSICFMIDQFFIAKKNLYSHTFLSLANVTILVCLATLINPRFIHGAFYPFVIFNNYGYNVIENNSIFAAFSLTQSMTLYYFILSIFILSITSIVSFRKVAFIDRLLIATFTFLGCLAIRNFNLFVIGTFIPLVIAIDHVMTLISKKYFHNEYSIKICIMICIFIITTPAFLWTISTHGIGNGIIDNAKDAVLFLKKNHISGKIYNNYNIGNYLEYEFYPKEKIFVDGSPEAYPKAFFSNIYYPIENSFASFSKESKQFDFNIVFYEHKNQTNGDNFLLYNLTRSKEWRMVYLNSSIVIFVRNIPKNQSVFKYTITEQNINLKTIDLNNKNNLINLSNFFRVIGWYELMYEMDLKYLSYDPNNCTALRHVSAILLKLNDPRAMIYLNRYENKCS